MNKIGLLTFYHSKNYGAELQAYALFRTLCDLGHETVLIDRRFNKEKKNIDAIKRKIFLGFEYLAKRKIRKFEKMHLYKSTLPIYTSEDFLSVVEKYDFDVIIVGSDQVWRLDNTVDYFNFDYFFANVKGSRKRVSYAASFGLDKWEYNANLTNKIKVFLNKFDFISVREDSGVEICKQKFEVDAVHVLDPTLLLYANDYLKLIEHSKPFVKKTLVVYVLDCNPSKEEIIEYIALKYSLEIQSINIVVNRYLFQKYSSVSFWLNAIYNADFIVTDSFHGTVFSLIFEKPFIVVPNKERGLSRIESLLNSVGLKDRLIATIGQFKKIDFNIDYVSVRSKIDVMRKDSIAFLINSLRTNNV